MCIHSGSDSISIFVMSLAIALGWTPLAAADETHKRANVNLEQTTAYLSAHLKPPRANRDAQLFWDLNLFGAPRATEVRADKDENHLVIRYYSFWDKELQIYNNEEIEISLFGPGVDVGTDENASLHQFYDGTYRIKVSCHPSMPCLNIRWRERIGGSYWAKMPPQGGSYVLPSEYMPWSDAKRVARALRHALELLGSKGKNDPFAD